MSDYSFTVKERFGVDLPKSYGIFSINQRLDKYKEERFSKRLANRIYLTDESGDVIDADFLFSKEGFLNKAGITVSLHALESKTYHVNIAENPVIKEKCSVIKRVGQLIFIKCGNVEIRVPKSGVYNRAIPAPLISYECCGLYAKGEVLFNSENRVKISSVIKNKNASTDISIRYELSDGKIYRFYMTVYKGLNDLVIKERCDATITGDFRLLFEGFEASRVYARMHTPPVNAGLSDVWRRIEYDANKVTNKISLQPFYCWDMACATTIQYFTYDASLSIVPIKAGLWENGIENRLSASNEKHVTISSPICNGRKVWVLSVGKGTSFEYEKIGLKGSYHNREHIQKHPIEKVYNADTLSAIYNGPSISDIHEWFSDFDETLNLSNMQSSLLGGAEDITYTRKRIENMPWLYNTISEHKDDKAAFDPAGVYMASGDEKYAHIAKECIMTWLNSRIHLFLKMGYSIHELVCIRLSRPLRQIALDFDLTCMSDYYSDDDRKNILSAFTFLLKCIESKDYWPDVKSGFPRGNRNFHSDRFATLGVTACLLSGKVAFLHVNKILRYVHKQISDELKYCVKKSGAWIEAPNYQAYSLSYLITLFSALKNCGYKNWFNSRTFKKTCEFLADIQTPYDIRYGAHMLPTLGDTASNYWSQSFSNIFAWAAFCTKGTSFSRKMMSAWKKAGCPVMSPGGELNSTFKMLMLTDYSLKCEKEKPKSESLTLYDGFGAIMRSDTGYVCIISGDISMHYDHDEGSFIWYENNIPLCIDIGSQYAPSCDASYWHNRISVDMKTDQSRGKIIKSGQNKDYSFVTAHTVISKVQNWPTWPIKDPAWNFRYETEPYEIPAHIWTRAFIYIPSYKALIIQDEVSGSLPFCQNFVLLTKAFVKKENTFIYQGQHELDITGYVYEAEDIKVEKWGHEGLEEPMFLQAFNQNYKDYLWMWDKTVTKMSEHVMMQRNFYNRNSTALTVLFAHEKDKTPVVQKSDNVITVGYKDEKQTIAVDVGNLR